MRKEEYIDDEKEKLYHKIYEFISLRAEGDNWDYKQEWYGKKKDDMLHDIICMANNTVDSDAYILIGVDNSGNVLGVENDCNRRDTQNLVDFLKDKTFAGGIRPMVYVQTLHLYGHEIDVIVVKNSDKTPFYLTDDFGGVLAGHIYTRVFDTNTPKNKVADINKVEKLWRKRFHLDKTPLEKMMFYLSRPENWLSSPDEEKSYMFYCDYPEFTIRHESDSRDGMEFYMFGQTDETPHWERVTLCYHQTMMRQFLMVCLDGYRCLIIAPERSFLSVLHEDVPSYVFYCKGSFEDIVNRFARFHWVASEDEYCYALNRMMKCVVYFESEMEREEFEKYVVKNKDLFNELYCTVNYEELYRYEDCGEYNANYMRNQFRIGYVLNVMLKIFRKNKKEWRFTDVV